MCNKGKSGVPAAGIGTDISTQANVCSAPTIYQTGIRIYDVISAVVTHGHAGQLPHANICMLCTAIF